MSTLTHRELLMLIPDEFVRSKAIAYAETTIERGIDCVNEVTRQTASRALMGSFEFDQTVEGFDYWYAVYLSLKKQHL